MKILLVVTKSNWGGAQRYVYDLATNLAPERFDVSVAFGPAADGKPGMLMRKLDESGVRTILVPALVRDVGFKNEWRAFLDVRALFKKEKPDVVHLNSSKAGAWGALAARLAGVPRIVFTIHGLPYDEKRSIISRLLIFCAMYCTFLLSHHIIAVSSDTYARVRRLPFLFKKTSIIYNGIETPLFENPKDAVRDLRALDPDIPEDGFRVGFIGEMHVNKDVRTALKAISETPSAHLILLGEGEERVRLELYANELGIGKRAHFLGQVPDAAKYLRAFDAVLLTSVKEGLPYVLLEAGAAYVPIVSVDIPGVHDIVLHNFTGLLTRRDPIDIRDALIRVHEDATLTRSLTEELGRRIQKSFSLRGMVEKTSALY